MDRDAKRVVAILLVRIELDRIDRKILSILQEDGRIANVELAERIGLSPTSIGERLKRLQREGFIEGYGARLNPHRLGLGLLVFVEVLLDPHSEAQGKSLKELGFRRKYGFTAVALPREERRTVHPSRRASAESGRLPHSRPARPHWRSRWSGAPPGILMESPERSDLRA